MTADEFERYRAIKAVNWATLRFMRESPLHYRHACDNVREDTPRLGVGRAVHTAVLEPDLFPSSYVVFDGDRRGNAWKEFKAAHADVTILRREERDDVTRMAEAVRSHPVAREYLDVSGTIVERSIRWTDESGLKCKGRPDLVSTIVADLKTTTTIDERRFRALATRMGYFHQLAFYRRGLRKLTGYDLPCALIAVETDPPHDVGVFVVDEESLARADEEITRLLRRVAECRAKNEWPGRHPVARTITMPEWGVEEQPLDEAA